jgi:2-C-methyl-D-erythritol 4-phosphate cytidylyltransferase
MSMHVLIPSAGAGSRLPGDAPKQYRRVAGAPIVAHTVSAFLACPRVTDITVVVQPGDVLAHAVLPAHPRLHVAEAGGVTRAQTVIQGLQWLRARGVDAREWELVHDAARCCVTRDTIERLMDACEHDTVGGLLAVPLADTLKRAALGPIGRAPHVATTVPREGLWLAQTPQMFRIGMLLQALERSDLAQITDEASAVEQMGLSPLLVAGSSSNFKVTYAEDLLLAEAILLARSAPAPTECKHG